MAPAQVVVMTPDAGEDGRLLGAGAAQIIRKPIAAAALAAELQSGFETRAMGAADGPKGTAKAS